MSASDKPGWRKSSFSNGAGNDCVELAFLGGAAALRDSKNPAGTVLLMAPSRWEALRDAVQAGRFDLA
jgi:hypothetical protein